MNSLNKASNPTKKYRIKNNLEYDRTLFWVMLGLMAFGFVMVTSSSIANNELHPYYYSRLDALYLSASLVIFFIVITVPIKLYYRFGGYLFLLSILLLISVFVVGGTINGAKRWIPLGIVNFQPTELAKLALTLFLARYFSKRYKSIPNSLIDAYVKPIGFILMPLTLLIIFQPDLGSVIVLFFITSMMIFISGANLYVFLILALSGVGVIFISIFFVSYRLVRLMTFWEPWQDPSNAGYQLVNSEMAIGSGGFWGKGIGNSMLKLNYLPEAHTDFIFSIVAEELGYVGVLLLLALIVTFMVKATRLGLQIIKYIKDKRWSLIDLSTHKLQEQKRHVDSPLNVLLFSGYTAFGIGMWFGFQSLFNIAVTTGLLPTKGLTLPFVSYGGSSLIIMTVATAILLRIDFEFRKYR